MTDKVPEKDPDESGDFLSKHGTLQLRELEADAILKEKVNRETDQRYSLRWIAVLVCVLTVIGMACLLLVVTSRLLNVDSVQRYDVAMFITPITTITTLSLSLLVAAFKGHKKKD